MKLEGTYTALITPFSGDEVDYEGLREEGIEVLRLPIVKKEDLN